MSSLARVRNSGPEFISVERQEFVFAGDLATVRFIGVSVIAAFPQARVDCTSPAP